MQSAGVCGAGAAQPPGSLSVQTRVEFDTGEAEVSRLGAGLDGLFWIQSSFWLVIAAPVLLPHKCGLNSLDEGPSACGFLASCLLGLVAGCDLSHAQGSGSQF